MIYDGLFFFAATFLMLTISHDFSSQNFMYCYLSSYSLVLSGLISVDKCMVRRSDKMGVVDVG